MPWFIKLIDDNKKGFFIDTIQFSTEDETKEWLQVQGFCGPGKNFKYTIYKLNH